MKLPQPKGKVRTTLSFNFDELKSKIKYDSKNVQ